jgi:hypothetical protein
LVDIDTLLRDKEVAMKRYIPAVAVIAALAGTAAYASSAAANSFGVSVAVPGFAVGFGNNGGYVSAYAPPPAYYAPAPYYVPAPAYYGPYPYYAPPVAYGSVVYYGGSYHHHYYHHH